MIKRDIFELIIEHLAEKEATVIIGPRQVGKTTILDHIEEYLLNEKKISASHIFRFNLDVITDRALFAHQDDVITFINNRKTVEETIYFFIDEVQRIEDAGAFIKGIYDLNLGVKFILTGSSSLEIKTKIQESMTGRKKIFQMYPLTINEYLRYVDGDLFQIVSEGKKLIDHDLVKLMRVINDFSIFGGYPRVALETNVDKKVAIIEELYTSYIDKDIAGFLKVKKIDAFNKLVSLLSIQVGNLLNVNKIASETGVEVKTLKDYLSVLENTFVIKLVKPFFTNAKKELVKSPMIYFVDNGLRNFAVSNFENLDGRIDRGALFENVILTELLKTTKSPYSIHYWRTLQKAEVDFIIRKGDGNVIPIEVKAKKMSEVTLSRSYYSFLSKYKPKSAFLINYSLRQQKEINGRIITVITPFEIQYRVRQ